MDDIAAPAPPPRKRRSRFLRFSLRTLLCFALLAGSIGLVVLKWPAWVLELHLDEAKLYLGNTRALVRENIDGANRLALWDLEHARKISLLPFDKKGPYFSADESRMALMNDSEQWYVYDLANGQISGELKNIMRLDQLSADGSRALGLNHYFQFAEFDVQSGQQLYTFEFPKRIRAAAYGVNDAIIVSHGVDEYAYAEQGRQVPGKPSLYELKPPLEPKLAWTIISGPPPPSRIVEIPFRDGRLLRGVYSKISIVGRDGSILWEMGAEVEAVKSNLGPRKLQRIKTTQSWHSSSLPARYFFNYAIFDNGRRIVAGTESLYTDVYRNRRPERWWGIAWLPEFWAASVLVVAFLWSLVRDWRMKT